MRKKNNIALLGFAALIALDLFVWHEIVFVGPSAKAELYFLDVGQGDASLAVLAGGVKILIDAGPDRSVLGELERVSGSFGRYIDLALVTHPQLDHFNGLNFLLGRYEFGAIIINGRTDAAAPEWSAFLSEAEKRRIPIVLLKAGDSIRYGENSLAILSPDEDWLQSAELNDTSLAALLAVPEFTALLTGDIGVNVEEDLVARYPNLRADILKVPHHGSKYSSSAALLQTVRPKLAVIEVGKNRYGHPTEEALDRLNALGARVFRTDLNGTIRVRAKDRRLLVFTER